MEWNGWHARNARLFGLPGIWRFLAVLSLEILSKRIFTHLQTASVQAVCKGAHAKKVCVCLGLEEKAAICNKVKTLTANQESGKNQG